MYLNFDKEVVSVHFETDNNQHFIDAFVEVACSTAFLEFAKQLAKIYNCEIKFETTALREGSVIKDFRILWKEKSIRVTIYGAILTALFYNPINHLLEKVLINSLKIQNFRISRRNLSGWILRKNDVN